MRGSKAKALRRVVAENYSVPPKIEQVFQGVRNLWIPAPKVNGVTPLNPDGTLKGYTIPVQCFMHYHANGTRRRLHQDSKVLMKLRRQEQQTPLEKNLGRRRYQK